VVHHLKGITMEITEKKIENIKPSWESINTFEQFLFTKNQIEIETTHHFCDGIYAREIFIPKGVVLTGKVHKTEHLNIIAKGKIKVLTNKGIKEITAPCTMVSSSGTKRVGHALEDTVWITIHSNIKNIKDLKKLENILIETTSTFKKGSNKCLG